jgi:hypothetical protein
MKRPWYFRLLIVAKLMAAWAIGLPIGAVILAPQYVRDDPARFWESIVQTTRFFGLFSLPLLGVASVVCLVFAPWVASYPFRWALAAVITTGLFGFAVFNIAGMAYALAVSVPAAVLFLLFSHAWSAGARSE